MTDQPINLEKLNRAIETIEQLLEGREVMTCIHCVHFVPDSVAYPDEPTALPTCGRCGYELPPLPCYCDDMDDYMEGDEDGGPEACAVFKKKPSKRAKGKEEVT